MPPKAVKKILSDNYLRLRGDPKPVNKDAAIAYGEALYREVKDRDDIEAGHKNDIAEAIAYFKS